jgi:hypothetical protein
MTGHAPSMNNLGIMLVLGQGSPPDPASAHTWFGVAARLGDAGAARNRDRTTAHLSPAALAASERAIAAWRAAPRPASALPLTPADTYPGAMNSITQIARAVNPLPPLAPPPVAVFDLAAPRPAPPPAAAASPPPVAELVVPPNIVVMTNLMPPVPDVPAAIVILPVAPTPPVAKGAPLPIVPRR